VREPAAAKDYPVLLAGVKARIQSAQYAALRAVNKELVGLYWDIGRLIVERQQSEGWGNAVVAHDAQVLPGCAGRAGAAGGRGPFHRHHPVQGKKAHHCRVCPELMGPLGANIFAPSLDYCAYSCNSCV
jgi:hypothetical protein